jgi:hypothetical protein
MTTMKAIAITEFGGPHLLTVRERLKLVPRVGTLGPLNFPRIFGVEAEGEIADTNDTDLNEGAHRGIGRALAEELFADSVPNAYAGARNPGSSQPHGSRF